MADPVVECKTKMGMRCQGKTKKGRQCTRITMADSRYCFQHQLSGFDVRYVWCPECRRHVHSEHFCWAGTP